jgi:multidrug transporter EmrE-like cation transporter
MHLSSAAVIITSVALSAGSQVLLKLGMSTHTIQSALKVGNVSDITLAILTSPSILSGFGCFGLSLVLWLFALAQTPLSSAYPFVALGILVTVLAGAMVFAEPISPAKAIGAVLILSGVVLVGIAG